MSEDAKTVKNVIVTELKKEGLNITEEAVVQAVKALFAVVPKLVGNIKNPIVAMVVGILATTLVQLEPKILAELDKIDGEDDAGR